MLIADEFYTWILFQIVDIVSSYFDNVRTVRCETIMCPSFSQREHNIDENHKIVWSCYDIFFLLLLYFKGVKCDFQTQDIILFPVS